MRKVISFSRVLVLCCIPLHKDVPAGLCMCYRHIMLRLDSSWQQWKWPMSLHSDTRYLQPSNSSATSRGCKNKDERKWGLINGGMKWRGRCLLHFCCHPPTHPTLYRHTFTDGAHIWYKYVNICPPLVSWICGSVWIPDPVGRVKSEFMPQIITSSN